MSDNKQNKNNNRKSRNDVNWSRNYIKNVLSRNQDNAPAGNTDNWPRSTYDLHQGNQSDRGYNDQRSNNTRAGRHYGTEGARRPERNDYMRPIMNTATYNRGFGDFHEEMMKRNYHESGLGYNNQRRNNTRAGRHNETEVAHPWERIDYMCPVMNTAANNRGFGDNHEEMMTMNYHENGQVSGYSDHRSNNTRAGRHYGTEGARRPERNDYMCPIMNTETNNCDFGDFNEEMMTIKHDDGLVSDDAAAFSRFIQESAADPKSTTTGSGSAVAPEDDEW